MSAANQYLPIATGVGANALTPAQWAALAQLRSQGFQSGIVPSNQFNTFLRQFSVPISALAQFVADYQSLDVVDDGSVANFEVKYEAALNAFILAALPAVVRTKLSANQTFYIRPNGNDTNTGLANTDAAAFQTIQGAFNAVTKQYDTVGYTLSLQLGVPGSYAGAVLGPFAGTVQILGESTWSDSSAYTIVNPGSQSDAIYSNVQQLNIRGVTIQPNYSGSPTVETGIQSAAGSVLLDNVRFIQNNNRTGYRDVYSNTRGSVQCINHIRFGGTGQRASVVEAINQGVFIASGVPASPTQYLTDGTITVTAYWAKSSVGGLQNWTNVNLSGAAANGSRYRAEAGGGIDTSGAGASYLPGSSNGSTDATTMGWYR